MGWSDGPQNAKQEGSVKTDPAQVSALTTVTAASTGVRIGGLGVESKRVAPRSMHQQPNSGTSSIIKIELSFLLSKMPQENTPKAKGAEPQKPIKEEKRAPFGSALLYCRTM
jgi:hypothetical protein